MAYDSVQESIGCLTFCPSKKGFLAITFLRRSSDPQNAHSIIVVIPFYSTARESDFGRDTTTLFVISRTFESSNADSSLDIQTITTSDAMFRAVCGLKAAAKPLSFLSK